MKTKFKVLDGTDVNPSEFKIPASDTQGNTVRNWFRCMPLMARQVEELVQSKQFPYGTRGDLLRHALHRHVKWLCGIQGPVRSVSGQVDTIIEILRDEAMNDDFALVFSKLKDRIDQHRKEGNDTEAVRLILLVRSHIAAMPKGFWRTRYAKRLRSEYSELLANTKGVNLCVLGEEEED